MAKLSDINKNNKFEVPENYFENFADDIHTRISEENLKEKFGNENPFAVPENYFENFYPNIKNNNTTGKIIELVKPYLSIAAGIVLVLVIWQVALTVLDNSKPVAEIVDTTTNESTLLLADIIDFSDIDSTVLENELDNYLYGSDENTIIDLTSNEENEMNFEIDSEAVYEYLLDFNDDIYSYEDVLAQL